MIARPTLAALALTLNALVWGLSWWPLRQLDTLGLHPLWATAWVFILATLILFFLTPSAWRGFMQHPQLIWLMVASGLTNVGFNWAVTTGDVVRVVLLFYLMPTWALLLAWWLLKEKPTRGALMRLALALCGVVMVLKTPGSPWPLPQDGADALALLSGFCFALTNIWLLRLQHTPASARMFAMFGGGALMAVCCASVASLAGIVAMPQVFDIAGSTATWVLGLSAAFLVSNFALQYGAARLSAHTTAMVMMSEVVFASVSSMALGASTPTWREALGGGMIVFAALLASLAQTKHSH